MLALSQNIDKELYFIYGLIALVILLIITIIIIDRIDSRREKEKSKKKLSDTLTMKPIREDTIIDNKYDDRVVERKEEERPKIKLEKKINVIRKEEPEYYVEPDLEKTQAQIRVEEITNALKEAGVDSEESYAKYEEFEEEQEKNAIISYEDLMNNYDRLYEENEKNQYIDDDSIPINIKELYELGKEERKVKEEVEEKPYVSPVYGTLGTPKDKDIENGNKFLDNLKELKSNL